MKSNTIVKIVLCLLAGILNLISMGLLNERNMVKLVNNLDNLDPKLIKQTIDARWQSVMLTKQNDYYKSVNIFLIVQTTCLLIYNLINTSQKQNPVIKIIKYICQLIVLILAVQIFSFNLYIYSMYKKHDIFNQDDHYLVLFTFLATSSVILMGLVSIDLYPY